MKTLVLFNRRYLRQERILIDDEDFQKVDKWSWSIDKNGYVRTTITTESGERKHVFLHRYVLDLKLTDLDVDHIDKNRFNNQKSNLRLCSTRENCYNRKIRTDTFSGFRGVWFRENRNKYRACIQLGGKTKTLGHFSDPEEAARTYDRAAKKHFGEFAVLNFPES